jgi:hypothetical protein
VSEHPATVLVTGSRKWKLGVYHGLAWAIEFAKNCAHGRNGTKPPTSAVRLHHGGAEGADTLAGKMAIQMGLMCVVHTAEWDKYGKGAGPIRNQAMLDHAKPDVCVAFLHTDLPCRGTRDMMERCFRAGVPVLVVTR